MKKHHSQSQASLLLALTIITVLSLTNKALSTYLLFNGFNSTDPFLLYGNATVDRNERVLTLTNDTHFAIGRALYGTKIPTKSPNSSAAAAAAMPFSTSFIFSMTPSRDRKSLPGHGLVFLFTPIVGIDAIPSAQNLGFINRTNNGRSDNHILGVEFDVFKNQEFGDIDDNHVGIDVNSLNSDRQHGAGVWGDLSNGTDERFFEKLVLNNGENYQAWIDYNDSVLTVSMARAGSQRPKFPLLSYRIDLSEVFVDEMYVGFTSATGQRVQNHRILAWSFSNDNFSLSDALVTSNLPSFVLPGESLLKSKAFVAGLSVGAAASLALLALLAAWLIRRRRRLARERAEMEDWESEYWPHRMSYREIERATKGFSEQSVIGAGGNGKVYGGVLRGGTRVAVKRITPSHDGGDGTREFLAEVSSLGRLKHRSLVGLRGWCKKERGVFVLVYDFMDNGSLDKRVYQDCEEDKVLGFDDRIRILRDVAKGVMYLHQGWECEVLHRDIKASNVLLDKDMNGRLGDFGLARIHGHGQVAGTTRVVGTVGYLAPEVVRSGRASARSDVFGFGATVLEVVCGRRPMEEGKEPLVEWVWKMMIQGRLLEAVDGRLRAKGEFDAEVAERVLHLGLLCAYPDPGARPSMRQVVEILEGKSGNGVSDGGNGEVEREDMDAYLLDKVRNSDLWSGFSDSFGYGSSGGRQHHPTFEDIKQSLSCSTSLSWSNSVAIDGIANGGRKGLWKFETI